jgi:hypothetical protein
MSWRKKHPYVPTHFCLKIKAKLLPCKKWPIKSGYFCNFQKLPMVNDCQNAKIRPIWSPWQAASKSVRVRNFFALFAGVFAEILHHFFHSKKSGPAAAPRTSSGEPVK